MNKKFAIIGSRGIPSGYGGFETFTQYLSTSLANRGFEVFVSCEYSPKSQQISSYEGVNLFYFPLKPPHGRFSRIIYEFLYDTYSLWWASRKADIIYMLGYSASLFFFIPRIFGKRLLVNPDGIEWKRNKFSPFIKLLLKFSERLMVFWTNEIIADSKAIKQYLDDKYGINSYFISYGVEEPPEIEWDLKKLPDILKNNVRKKDFWLVVSRLEPENSTKMIVEGYLKSKSLKPLVIIGNFSSNNYKSTIEDFISKSPKKVFLTGGIYDKEVLNMLRQNCFAYIHGHSVGGTNPSLLEIMIMKTIILCLFNPFNKEVCNDSAIYFKDADELCEKMEMVDADR